MSQNQDELFKALDAVRDEESFLQFLLALRDDREAVRWARDSVNGNSFYKRPENPWRRCADILFAAKGYE
jgi:hypothetical protein